MKIIKSRNTDWQELQLTKYEARVLAENKKKLEQMGTGEISGVCIGGADIELVIVED